MPAKTKKRTRKTPPMFEVADPKECDKDLPIYGPATGWGCQYLTLTLDFDDVNHPLVLEAAHLIARLLNPHAAEFKALIKREQERYEAEEGA